MCVLRYDCQTDSDQRQQYVHVHEVVYICVLVRLVHGRNRLPSSNIHSYPHGVNPNMYMSMRTTYAHKFRNRYGWSKSNKKYVLCWWGRVVLMLCWWGLNTLVVLTGFANPCRAFFCIHASHMHMHTHRNKHACIQHIRTCVNKSVHTYPTDPFMHTNVHVHT